MAVRHEELGPSGEGKPIKRRGRPTEPQTGLAHWQEGTKPRENPPKGFTVDVRLVFPNGDDLTEDVGFPQYLINTTKLPRNYYFFETDLLNLSSRPGNALIRAAVKEGRWALTNLGALSHMSDETLLKVNHMTPGGLEELRTKLDEFRNLLLERGSVTVSLKPMGTRVSFAGIVR